MTPEHIAAAKSIVQHAAANGLETDEVMLLGHALNTIEADRSYIKDLEDLKRDIFAVLDSYQPQEIAKEIKVPEGQDVGTLVLPWIQNAIKEIEGLRAELVHLRAETEWLKSEAQFGTDEDQLDREAEAAGRIEWERHKRGVRGCMISDADNLGFWERRIARRQGREEGIKERDQLRAELSRLSSAPVAVEVPEYGECAMLDQNGEDLNPLQEFVYCQEPSPNPPGIICGVDPKAQFREQLQAVLDWASSRLSTSPQPSDRILKEGERAVPVLLSPDRAFAAGWFARGSYTTTQMTRDAEIAFRDAEFAHWEKVRYDAIDALRSGEDEGRMG